MQIRIIQIITLAMALAFAPPALAAKSDGDEKAAFNAAYKAYQEAVEAKNLGATLLAAEEALELGKQVLPDNSPSLAALHVNFGTALLSHIDFAKRPLTMGILPALDSLEEAIRRYELLYGKDDKRLIAPLWWLVQVNARSGSEDDKIPRAKRLRRLTKRHYGKDSVLFADAALQLGISHYRSLHSQKAAAGRFLEAYDTFKRILGQQAYKTGYAAFWLGKAAEQRKRRGKAERYYLEALEIFEETVPPGHDLQLQVHTFLIKLYEDRGKSDEATLHCQAISQLRPLAGVDGYTPLYKKQPRYPQSAQMQGRSGYVLVDFTVTAIGTVSNATVFESSGGKDFEPAALKAVSGFRYAPAVQDGVLVETPGVRNLITFEIVDD